MIIATGQTLVLPAQAAVGQPTVATQFIVAWSRTDSGGSITLQLEEAKP